MKIDKLLILIALTQVTACSNRAIYESIQHHQRTKCIEERPAAYQECIERTNKSYEEYQRERKEVEKD